MMSETGYVYALKDPRTDEIKYIGATVDPEQRLQSHLAAYTNQNLEDWKGELAKVDYQPEMEILRECEVDNLAAVEKEVVENYRNKDGIDLLNSDTTTPYRRNNSVVEKSGAGTTTVRLPDVVVEQAKEIQEQHDFTSVAEAIRFMAEHGAYDPSQVND